MTHHEILAFAGPYSLDGSTFTAFEPILQRISDSKPSLVIMIGPFYDSNLAVSKDPVYLNSKKQEVDFEFKKRRTE